MMMMPSDDLICTGCGFLAQIKSSGWAWMGWSCMGAIFGGWNETQHSKRVLVLDGQGLHSLFFSERKQESGIRKSFRRFFAKNLSCVWVRGLAGKDPYHSGTGCLCPPGKQNWVPQKKERSKKPTKGKKLRSIWSNYSDQKHDFTPNGGLAREISVTFREI